MNCPGAWSFEFALNKRLIDDHLRVDIGEFAPLPCLRPCFRMGSKLRCIRSTPTETQSIGENDFECLASTGVNAPGTMLPDQA